MRYWDIIGFVLLLMLVGCSSGGGGKTGEAPGTSGGNGRDLSVRQPYFQLQEEPGENGRPIMELLPGTVVMSLGQSSGFTTHLERQGRNYNEPWLLVETVDGKQGWAYAAAFMDAGAGEAGEGWGLGSLFGEALAARLEGFNYAFDTLSEAEGLARHLSEGYGLRDSLMDALARHEGSAELLFRARAGFPLFVPYRLKQAGEVYLFIDFRPYLRKAAVTTGPADDQLLAFCLAVYPEDSIEYFFPSWTIEDEVQQGHSLLGRGIHYSMLKKLDKLLVYNDLLHEEIGRYRGMLLNDIAARGVTYWETRDKAAAELDSILSAHFKVVGEKGEISLSARRRQFDEPEKYGIQFDHQSGIYE
ncbi:MAG: SH3 domain-containing protein [Phaeodactylibacter sp.]|nr:SH3 domain-containing protein [Phaeodactylibacter sp.]MCB9274249.1 SH3 domain-containing protein [Lewinellaceae bacterium]